MSFDSSQRERLEQEVERYEADQQLCDIADMILKIFSEKQINVHKSLRVLEKAKTTIEASIQSANWGSPLTCGLARNEASVWDHVAVAAEFNRRKCQDDS